MNIGETSQALALAQAYDNRTVGEVNVRAWHAILGDFDAADVMEAIRRHYAASTEWMMPAHVRRIVGEIELERSKAARRWAPGQAGVAPEDALPALLPGEVTIDMSPEVRRMIDALRERLESGDRTKLFPRQTYWEREQRAFSRSEAAEPNPFYRSQRPTCGIPAPHPAHSWQIGPNEGEAEPDKFECAGG